MFLHYYVNTHAQANGTHEVHHEGCATMPPLAYRQYLGMFESAVQAVHMAKVIYPHTAKGCQRCMKIHAKPVVRVRR